MKKALVAMAAVASLAFILRRRRRTKDRVNLYYEDGSMVSLEPGSVEAGRIAPLAGDALRAVRGPAT